MYSGLYERRPDTPFIFTNGQERKYNMAEQSLKEKTAKGLFWGGFSNGIQQLLNLLFGIIITRMLDSTDYGMIGMLAIFTAVANSIQESGFTAALANKQTFRHEDYNAVFWFSFLMGASLYLLLFFCAPFIAAFYKTPQLIPLSRFLFLGFLISSCGTAHNAVLFGERKSESNHYRTIVFRHHRNCHGIQWNGFLGAGRTANHLYFHR